MENAARKSTTSAPAARGAQIAVTAKSSSILDKPDRFPRYKRFMKRFAVAFALLAALAGCRQQGIQLPLAPAESFRQAETAFGRRDYTTAVEAYRRYLDGRTDPAYVPRACYQLALAHFRQHHYAETLAVLDELKQRVPGQRWTQAFALRGDAELALGERTKAVQAWEQAWLAAVADDRPFIQDRLQSVREQLTVDERSDVDQTVKVPAVRQALGLAGHPQAIPVPPPSPVAQATATPATVAQAPVTPAVASNSGDQTSEEPAPAEAEAALTATDESELVEPEPSAKVACLLPLSGPDSAYGKRALAGLRLAFADVPRQLVVRDSGGESATTTKLLEQLQADPSIVAVIGPLRSSEAEVAAPLAERTQLPMLLLSQREGLTGHFVMQAAMTRSQQVDLLIRYAVETLNLHKFGVLYPNDGYGTAFATAFKSAASARGANVAGAFAYQPGAPNDADVAATAQRWHEAGVDGVFIPDAASAAAAVAVAVRGSVPDMALLGTESWNDAAALSSAGAPIDGAIFTDAFFVDSARSSTRQFVERFERGAGRPPTVFEAQAFDAGMIVRHALSAGATSREQIIAQLSGLGTFEGAGELHATADGLQRRLSLLRYRDGRVEEVAN